MKKIIRLAVFTLLITICAYLCTLVSRQEKEIKRLDEELKTANLWLDIENESLNYWYSVAKGED